MRKIRANTQDFSEKDLPKNRREVYSTILAHRFSMLARITALTMVFLFPLFLLFIVFNASYIRPVYMLIEENSDYKMELSSYIFELVSYRNLIAIPLFILVIIGLSGMMNVIQKIAWDKIVFFTDYFEFFKKNIFRFILLGLIWGISFFLFDEALYGIPLINTSKFLVGISFVFSIFQFIFVSVFVLFAICQNNIYLTKFKYLLSNSLKFTINSFFVMAGFYILLILPIIFLFIGNIYFDICSYVAFLVSLFLFTPMIVLYSNNRFDYFINKNDYPQIYKLGIYDILNVNKSTNSNKN